jgi:hypothetical protein
MDQQVFELARQFQTKLERIDAQADRDSFIWAHGFLIGLIDRIETSIPTLRAIRLQTSSKADLYEAKRILSELTFEDGSI